MDVKYTDRVIAFIDVLGFSNLIARSAEDDALMKKIFYALYYLEGEKDNSKAYGKAMEYGRVVSVFSDSVVISFPSARKTFTSVLYEVMRLQEGLAFFGLKARGAITFGKLFHTQEVIYGPAIVAAHSLESKAAIHPRVIIDESFFEEYDKMEKDMREFLPDYVVEPHPKTLVKQDVDGFYFTDFTRFANQDTIQGFASLIKEELLSTKDPGVKSKLFWLKNYLTESS